MRLDGAVVSDANSVFPLPALPCSNHVVIGFFFIPVLLPHFSMGVLYSDPSSNPGFQALM